MEMPIKAMRRYHLTPTRVVTVKDKQANKQKPRVGKGVENSEPSVLVDGKVK